VQHIPALIVSGRDHKNHGSRYKNLVVDIWREELKVRWMLHRTRYLGPTGSEFEYSAL
jgi:hypothetical protein